MGIKKLNQFLETYAHDAFIDLPVTAFRNQKIAIDMGIFMYKRMLRALSIIVNKTNLIMQDLDRNQVMSQFIDLSIKSLKNWLKYNITPVLVFDGQSPIDKNHTLLTRNARKLEQKAKIDYLTTIVRDPLKCKLYDVKSLKHELSQYVQFTNEEREMYKQAMQDVGLPCLTATGEAEKLCSLLCIEKQVMGVFTLDTDVYAYGCPLVIKGISKTMITNAYGYKVPMVSCVDMIKVLCQLQLTLDQFVDLCIMFQCDYNKSIKGVGVQKSYEYILRYKSINWLPLNLNIEVLNHHMCREEFQYQPANECISEGDLNNLELQPIIETAVTAPHVVAFQCYYNKMHLN